MKEFTFLGWSFNTSTETIKITEERRLKLLKQLSEMIKAVQKKIPKRTRDLAGIRGKLNFLHTVNPLTNFHLREISRVIN